MDWWLVTIVCLFVILGGFIYGLRAGKKDESGKDKKKIDERVCKHMESVDWMNGYRVYQFIMQLPPAVRSSLPGLIDEVSKHFNCAPIAARSMILRINYILVKKLNLSALIVEVKEEKA